jgi:hypothetical protein
VHGPKVLKKKSLLYSQTVKKEDSALEVMFRMNTHLYIRYGWLQLACVFIFPQKDQFTSPGFAMPNQEQMCSTRIVLRKIEPDLLSDVPYAACIRQNICYGPSTGY